MGIPRLTCHVSQGVHGGHDGMTNDIRSASQAKSNKYMDDQCPLCRVLPMTDIMFGTQEACSLPAVRAAWQVSCLASDAFLRLHACRRIALDKVMPCQRATDDG
jgi:hypothetical protein